jgi:hypothetical protein
MAKTVVTILGVVFIAIGLLGFVNNPILGIFGVNTLHNLVHIVSGVLALWAVNRGMDATVLFSKVFGIVYGVVAVLGFVLPAFMMSLLAVDMTDNILHVVLAVIFLYIGFGSNQATAMNEPAAPAV